MHFCDAIFIVWIGAFFFFKSCSILFTDFSINEVSSNNKFATPKPIVHMSGLCIKLPHHIINYQTNFDKQCFSLIDYMIYIYEFVNFEALKRW